MSARIVLNGKEYDGIEAMPPDVRKDYEAVLESLKNTGGEEVLSLLERGERASIHATFREIVVNGKKYGSVEEMPADVRRVYEQAVARMSSAAAESRAVQPVQPAAPPRPAAPARPAGPAPPAGPARPSRPAIRPPVVEEQVGRGGWVGGFLKILFWMALGAVIALWVVRRWHLRL